ncbi:DUF6708 domain-containing protein [Pseudomonas sp. GCM10022188]|uniref:DUF6708 domain-containing protein n=1 Tax=Pseudomonas TaxID=286 RepID=UPI001E3137D9|nr:DUF6708 domain-containing protein [Pseudomonas oryzagri]MCC6075596.1 hypothetical protein [Pseudomonas oryzagri]
MTQQPQDELDLRNQRPSAGEARRFTTGEALFLAPLPVPTGHLPMDLGGSFIEVNDTYLDVGQSNTNKAFQAQLMIWGTMSVGLSLFLILPLLAATARATGPYQEDFWGVFWEFFSFSVSVSWWLFLPIVALSIYPVLSTTFKKARIRPLRFNRQRREVCYFPEGSDEPIIQPWEELVAWVSVSTGFTGEGVMSTYTFGMAIDNPKTDMTHFLTHGVFTPAHGISKWEAIRTYMEKGPEHCPGKAPYEGRHTFDIERADLHEAYREGYASAIGVAWWYLCRVVTWWRFPYWVAEWDHGYAMKTMPASIAQWSQPLPVEQWAKPSQALKEQTARLEKAYANGQNFTTYFNSQLGAEPAERCS